MRRAALFLALCLVWLFPSASYAARQAGDDIMTKLKAVHDCALKKGVDLPLPEQGGAPRPPLNAEEQAVLTSCMEANGLSVSKNNVGSGAPTEEEKAKIESTRACASAKGLNLPEPSEAGGMVLAPADEAQQEILRACLKENGINTPTGATFVTAPAPMPP